MTVKIDDDVPMPASIRSEKYPWMQMEVGQSFLANEVKEMSLRRVASMARPDGRRFSVRKTPEGLRCWRVK